MVRLEYNINYYNNILGDEMTKEEWKKFYEIKTIEDFKTYENRYKNNELKFERFQYEISFLYNLGLFYSEHYETHNPIDIIFRKDDKYYLAIYYYLKAIKIYEDNRNILDTDKYFIYEVIRRLYVNIGNEFSNQFRSINALSYFRKALRIDECFDMAIGNFALGIEHHNPIIGLDKNKYCLVFNFLHELYFDIHLENLDSGRELFKNKKIQYLEIQAAYINTINHGLNANYEPYLFFTEINVFDKSFENWCVKNTLYLNYVNDLGDFNEVKFDIDLSDLSGELDLSEAQLYTLNSLFKLYVLQRQKIFDCKELNDDVILHDLAQAFQCLYSYFDKIAFFIYKYFRLSGNERFVNINSIWEMKDETGNILLEYKNQYLYNIYWLRKEYRESSKSKMKINELFSPDAQDYANIRNMLEHKEFSFERIEGLPYLNPILLYSKTLKLANVVRDMILSIVQMVITEKKLVDPVSNKRNLDLMYFAYEGFK